MLNHLIHLSFQIREFKISGQTFEGTSVDSSFVMKEVHVQKIPPLAFNFDAVGEFNIINSKFERVPMWGFKVNYVFVLNILVTS